jgi:hypothetical protein
VSQGGWIGAAVVGVIAALAVQSWFIGGSAIAGGDLTPPYGLTWLAQLFDPWVWNGSNLGAPGVLELQAPWGAVLYLTHALGGSAGLAERFWCSLLFVGAGLAAFGLLRVLRFGSVASVLGALIYLFNPYVVSSVGTNTVFLAAMVLLAVYPAIVFAVATGRWRARAGMLTIVLSAPLLGFAYNNPPLVGMVVVAIVGSVVIAWWLEGKAAAVRALRMLTGGVPFLVIASAYWIVPSVLQLRVIATGQLSPLSSWAWTEGRSTLANGLWLNTIWAWPYSSYYPYAHLYEEFPLDLVRYLLPAFAFASLAFVVFRHRSGSQPRRSRLTISVAAVALFVVVFSTGTNAPGSVVFDPLCRLPHGWLLQQPGRFLMVGGLAYSVLAAVSITTLGEEWRFHRAEISSLSQHRGLLERAVLLSLVGAVMIIPGFPLLSGAIVRGPIDGFPSSHVSLPAYWAATARYLNTQASPGSLLVLPPDDFYQMPYRWYYGNDGFISNLLTRHVVDPTGQGYQTSSAELLTSTQQIASSLLAHDWLLANRLLDAVGTSEILVRGDIEANFPGRDIIAPAALAAALSRDPGVSLVYHDGPLRVFRLRQASGEFVTASNIVTVDSAVPDLRALALFAKPMTVVSGPPRAGYTAVLQAPPVSQWVLDGPTLSTFIHEGSGWRYRFAELAPITSRSVVAEPPSRRAAAPFIERRVASTHGVSVIVSLQLGRNLLRDGGFAHGLWQPVSNCDDVPGTTSLAHIRAVVEPHAGPGGTSALRLSANADTACEIQLSAWRSGAILVSVWTRNVSGATPSICLWEAPLDHCKAILPLSSGSGWIHYQQVVVPDSGTTSLSLYLYANGKAIEEYGGIGMFVFPTQDVPVILGYPTTHPASGAKLLASPDSYAPGWRGPTGAIKVCVDGMRNGWLGTGPMALDSVRYLPAGIDTASRVASLAATGVALLLWISLMPGLANQLFARRRRRRGGCSATTGARE